MKDELIEYIEMRINHLSNHPHVKPFVLTAKVKELKLILKKLKEN